jgi:NADH-quinone oxidoreductase subunit A
MLQQYLPVLVFATLGILVGGAFATLNLVLGPKRPKSLKQSAAARQADPYECGLPSEVSSSFRFGVSFYLVAMLFILFDIEVVFLYPVATVFSAADSLFVLVEVIIFVALLFVAFIYVWRKGALDWR